LAGLNLSFKGRHRIRHAARVTQRGEAGNLGGVGRGTQDVP
jgi:hypothetical protein